MITLAALLLSPAAHAFCGTYMGSAGSQIFNNASQIAVVRQDGRTTLTLANDYEGELSEFALVVPVPEILTEADVAVVDPEVIQGLDAYSAPRRVSYSCYESDGGAADGGATDGTDVTADGVTVEGEFTKGEYHIVILSAKESTGLVDWLQGNGYGIPDGAEDILGEYIEAGSYFFAAQVALDKLPDGRTWLSPLQFGYNADILSLPIRMGTINSPGAQDLIVYAIGDADKGQTLISNYDEVTMDSDCMWPSYTDDFDSFYASSFQDAMSAHPGAGWVLEYAWNTGSCDPCSAEPPDSKTLSTLGYDGDPYSTFLTRLHMRYAPDEVGEDLVFYQSGITTNTQIKYIDYDACLVGRYPLCSGFEPDGADSGAGPGAEDPKEDSGCSGCGAPGPAGLLLVPWALLGVWRRRRRG